MAIAYTASGNKGSVWGNNNTTANWAVDVSGGAGKILILLVLQSDAAGDIDSTTSVTYNSVNLTKVLSRKLNTSNQWIALWYLIDPASGSNTMTWNASTNSYSYGAYGTYSGTSLTVGSNTASADVASGNLALTITTQGDNAWLVSTARSTETGVQDPGTNTTERTEFAVSLGDTNAAQTPIGSYSNNWTANGGNKIGGVALNFYEASATNTGRFFAFM